MENQLITTRKIILLLKTDKNGKGEKNNFNS